ncbi:MAG: hypothetical protein COT71_00665 [Candidatus Andersenbacteria bacterium CG10_big_fil_rev_8_21_14_0_10_54_11]|uniref:Uncharacterized protein n=1 Tax=Candidatus Andersenbacteria bacterium CG10_big_fil_rev_8_21_14_0_10_54_11 TaxID=1974485 RepID=A0A2M6X0A1_9BACT|nr:MAG: hypothetical protein COT71_00665 [Candidatus Andersenbacteria bacterium CG10_big_fil_rev_8_21_14_0_10_54_11]
MRDPSELYTRRGTPLIVAGSRVLFLVYFAAAAAFIVYNVFPASHYSFSWLLYLLALYYILERLYAFFAAKNIDMSFAFPLALVTYVLNLVSMALNAQSKLPIINRAEHFVSFIILSYVVWIFFLKYLPQKVWRNHPYYTAIIVLAVTALFGVVNEHMELFMDELLGSRLIGDRLDTSLDLLMNTLGAGTFLATRLILLAGSEQKAAPLAGQKTVQ